jgi:hypothetical protein
MISGALFAVLGEAIMCAFMPLGCLILFCGVVKAI